MINLYQLLQIAPDSSATQIQQALEQSRHRLNPKEIQAVESWLLVPEVRTRYDAQLRQKQPAFFQSQTSTIQPNPTVQAAFKPSSEQGYYTPKLYNPTIITVLAILLSPLIGAWLCAINWRELGNREAANQNMNVVYGVLLFGLASALFVFNRRHKNPIVCRLTHFAGMVFHARQKTARFPTPRSRRRLRPQNHGAKSFCG